MMKKFHIAPIKTKSLNTCVSNAGASCQPLRKSEYYVCLYIHMTALKSILLNVEGLVNINKQLKLFTHLINNFVTIAFVTETHLKHKQQIAPFLSDWVKASS